MSERSIQMWNVHKTNERRERTVTNYERITSMSIDEMAEFIVSVSDDALQGDYWDCEKWCKEWLETEIRE